MSNPQSGDTLPRPETQGSRPTAHPHIATDVSLYCDAMNEMLLAGGGQSSRDKRAMLSGASVFFDWGEAMPAEALRFASSLANDDGVNAPESMALCLAHLGACRGLGMRLPFDLSMGWTTEMDGKGGMESILQPSMTVAQDRYREAIVGFGRLPGDFHLAASVFMGMISSHWTEKNYADDRREEPQLDPHRMLDDTLGEMASSLYHFDLKAGSGDFARIKAYADEALLQATLQELIKDPATPRIGGLRL